jgi:anaerobic selenocysteine-containing dehydrogenase
MATYGSTNIASTYFQVKAGGDAAALKGIAKALLRLEAEQGEVLDRAFIDEHTLGFADFARDVDATPWPDIERESGLTRGDLERVAAAYAKSNATIITYGMGITQHNKGTSNVRLIADLLLMRGNIGKPGAGICRCADTPTYRATVPSASRKSRAPVSRQPAAGVWFYAAAGAWSRCGKSATGDDRRRIESAALPWRELRGGYAG